MKIQVTLGERKRKEVAQIIGELVGDTYSYMGAPSYAYEIGKFVLGRDAEITVKKQSRFTAVAMRKLLEGLRSKGIEAEADGFEENAAEKDKPAEETSPEPPADCPDIVTISLPLDKDFDEKSFQNLCQLVSSKSLLIKKSLEVADLSVIKAEETINFPWFERELTQEELSAYTIFIKALIEMAMRQNKVLATEKPTANEKFTFRLFLVRLGLIGDAHASTRHILLRNLSGNGSYKNGVPPQRETQAAACESCHAGQRDAYPPCKCEMEAENAAVRKMKGLLWKMLDYILYDDVE